MLFSGVWIGGWDPGSAESWSSSSTAAAEMAIYDALHNTNYLAGATLKGPLDLRRGRRCGDGVRSGERDRHEQGRTDTMFSTPHYSSQSISAGVQISTGILDYPPSTATDASYTAAAAAAATSFGENGGPVFHVGQGFLSRGDDAVLVAPAPPTTPSFSSSAAEATIATAATSASQTESDSELVELSRLIDLDAPPRDGADEGGFSYGSPATAISASASSSGGSVWSSEDDERDQKLHSPSSKLSASSSTLATIASSPSATVSHHLMASMLVDLNCNDENFSCFGESILFGCEEDELQNVEEVQPADLALPPENSSNEVEQRPNVAATLDVHDGPLERDSETKRYHCPHCEKSFQYGSRLRRHLTAHQSKRHQCSLCDKFFSRADVLASHRAKVHGEPESVTSSPVSAVPPQKRFSCPQCPAYLKSRHHLQGRTAFAQ